MNSSIPTMMTIKQTAAAFGLSTYMIRMLANEGKINGIRTRGMILINCDSLRDYLNCSHITDKETESEEKAVYEVRGIRPLA